MMVRSVSHIFPAGAVQRPQPTGAATHRQTTMGTPVEMAHEAEKTEPVQKSEVVQFERITPTIAAATHDAVTRLNHVG
jgi:hypothetical protein